MKSGAGFCLSTVAPAAALAAAVTVVIAGVAAAAAGAVAWPADCILTHNQAENLTTPLAGPMLGFGGMTCDASLDFTPRYL